jgi:predicted Zn-dependent peptidase
MTRIAKAELVSGELPSVDQTLELIDAVTAEEIHAVARTLFNQNATIGVVGPYKNVREFTSAMKGK